MRISSLALALVLLWGCQPKGGPGPIPEPPRLDPAEEAVLRISLEGDAASRDIEFSGMAWSGDDLILLPQYPGSFGDRAFAIPKAELLKAVQGDAAALTPRDLAFDDGGATEIEGFEGFEAIAFEGQRVYVSVETESGRGYLMKGQMAPELGGLVLDGTRSGPMDPQAKVDNMSYEALLVAPDQGLLAFFEAYGAKVNSAPSVKRFGLDARAQADLPMAAIEYRITDVTAPDDQGRFWAINYWYPGDKDLATDRDPIVDEYGEGPTHKLSEVVERLVELKVGAAGVVMSGAAPIGLQLAEKGRNWEGIARLDDLGFLIVTDKFPETILAFVPRRVSP